MGHNGKPRLDPQKTRQVKASVKKYRELFGLPNWPVYYGWVAELREKDGSPELAAYVEVLPSDNEVHMYVNTRIKLDQIDRVVAHEMVHWLLNDLQEFVFQQSDTDKENPFLKYLLERIVEAIAIAVTKPSRKGAAVLLEAKHEV